MPRMIGDGLSRREREIMEILHRLEAAVKTFLTDREADLSADELARLAEMIDAARNEDNQEDAK